MGYGPCKEREFPVSEGEKRGMPPRMPRKQDITGHHTLFKKGKVIKEKVRRPEGGKGKWMVKGKKKGPTARFRWGEKT